jgi:hypothetical protein
MPMTWKKTRLKDGNFLIISRLTNDLRPEKIHMYLLVITQHFPDIFIVVKSSRNAAVAHGDNPCVFFYDIIKEKLQLKSSPFLKKI